MGGRVSQFFIAIKMNFWRRDTLSQKPTDLQKVNIERKKR